MSLCSYLITKSSIHCIRRKVLLQGHPVLILEGQSIMCKTYINIVLMMPLLCSCVDCNLIPGDHGSMPDVSLASRSSSLLEGQSIICKTYTKSSVLCFIRSSLAINILLFVIKQQF